MANPIVSEYTPQYKKKVGFFVNVNCLKLGFRVNQISSLNYNVEK